MNIIMFKNTFHKNLMKTIIFLYMLNKCFKYLQIRIQLHYFNHVKIISKIINHQILNNAIRQKGFDSKNIINDQFHV